MSNLPSPEAKNLLDAIDSFMENPPRDLPDGVADQLSHSASGLRGYGPSGEDSPGMKEALSFTDGTGESYSKAATGKDRPSPGQLEHKKVMSEKTGFDGAMEAARDQLVGPSK